MGTVIGVIILGSILAFLIIGSSVLEKEADKTCKHH